MGARNRGSKSFADEDDDFEDDWSDFNSLESLDEGDLEEIQVNGSQYYKALK